MPAKITAAELLPRITEDPDMHALGLLPIDSFARHAYQTKTYSSIGNVYKASDTDADECAEWDVTPEEWVEEMDAARIALGP